VSQKDIPKTQSSKLTVQVAHKEEFKMADCIFAGSSRTDPFQKGLEMKTSAFEDIHPALGASADRSEEQLKIEALNSEKWKMFQNSIKPTGSFKAKKINDSGYRVIVNCGKNGGRPCLTCISCAWRTVYTEKII
jgi:hypothetical protein